MQGFRIWLPAAALLPVFGCVDDGTETPDDAGTEYAGEDARPEGHEIADDVDDGGDEGSEAHEGPCTNDEQCSDDLWCNGRERCLGGSCTAGTYPCDDRIDCTVDSCDESADRCANTPDHDICSNGLPCDGAERCLPTSGCVAGSRPDCRDEDPCTIDDCFPDRGGCMHDPRDIDDDGYHAAFAPGAVRCPGDDCNDSDPAVNPGAAEICNDVRDNDCDGAIDFADEDCRPANDTCAGAMPLVEGTRTPSSTRGTRNDYPSLACGWGNNEVVFHVTLDATRDLIVTAAGLGPNLDVDIQRVCGDRNSSLRCASGSTVTLRKNSLDPGAYYVIVQTDRDGDFTIEYRTEGPTPIPPNDRCAGATDIPEANGTTRGTLFDTSHDYVPSCAAGSTFPDVFYRLELTEPRKVTMTLQTALRPAGTYLALSTECGAARAELACAGGSTATITRNYLDAGIYYVTVDSSDAGPFTLDVRFDAPIPPPANDRCPGAADISGGGFFVGTMVDTYRDYPPSCSTALPSDVVYVFTTTDPQDVTVSVSPIGAAVNYVAALRTTCADGATEIACRSGNPARFTRRSLPAGTYYVVVSGPATGPGDSFVLFLTIAPPTPTPANDICTGAPDVSAGGTFVGSTTACGDDYEPTCTGAAGYLDIVYRLDLAGAADVTLALGSAAADSFLDLRSGACGTGTTSIRCLSGASPRIFQRNVPAGSYWILVETQTEATTTIDVTVGPPTSACDGAPVINVDYGAGSTFTYTTTGTTAGRPNDFVPGCLSFSTAPDMPYRLVLPFRSSVTFTSDTIGYDGALHVRSACDVASSEVGCNDDCGSTSRSCIGPLTLDAGSYYVIQDGFSSGSGSFTLTIAAIRL